MPDQGLLNGSRLVKRLLIPYSKYMTNINKKQEVVMKTKHVVFAFPLFLLFISCSERSISDNEKKQALEDYTICNQIANEWLYQLDSSNYSHLLSLKLPDGYYTNNLKEKLLSGIYEAQKVYGKINIRKFFGAHIWSGEKLLTYAPDIEDKYLTHLNVSRSEDGFYIVI